MATTSQANLLDSVMNLLPDEHLNKGVRDRLKTLQKRLDGLFFLDETAELAVDRQAFIALAGDADLVPTPLRDVVILETAKHLGRRLKGVGRGRRVGWLEAGRFGALNKSDVADIRKRGLKKTMSTKDLSGALREWYPDLSKEFVNLDSAVVHQRILKNLERNRTVWDCVVANLGWWAAINVIGTIIIAIVMLASGVPWPWVLAACIAFTAFFTAFVILSCVTNTEWHF